MKRRQKRTLLLIGGAVALVAITAGATTYATGNMPEIEFKQEKETKSQPVVSTNTVQTSTQAPAPQIPACDDDNIVGKVLGGAVGGVAGSQIGKGNGKTAATIGGTVGGTLLGEKYIPTDDVTCR